jgi:hypothetical protein
MELRNLARDSNRARHLGSSKKLQFVGMPHLVQSVNERIELSESPEQKSPLSPSSPFVRRLHSIQRL